MLPTIPPIRDDLTSSPENVGVAGGIFEREPGLADALIAQTGYFGIFLVLVLGGLGLPVPEEAPIIVAAILARKGTMHWIPALGSCFAGVLVGDFIVYFLGFFYGEKVLSLPLTRKFLTKAREAQIKGYFHRHGVKILVLGRFAVGFRTAAYLTAGILRLPPFKLFVTDLRRVVQHLSDVRAGLRFRQQGGGRVAGGAALHHRGRSPWVGGLAVASLRQGPAPRRAGGRAAGPGRGGGSSSARRLPRQPLGDPAVRRSCPTIDAAPGGSQVSPGLNVATTADPIAGRPRPPLGRVAGGDRRRPGLPPAEPG